MALRLYALPFVVLWRRVFELVAIQCRKAIRFTPQLIFNLNCSVAAHGISKGLLITAKGIVYCTAVKSAESLHGTIVAGRKGLCTLLPELSQHG